jgi:glucose-specific phosphotransferase system IIA component
MFNIFNKQNSLTIYAPMSGKIIDLTELEDPVFSEKMVGDGVAIEPNENIVLSPVKGKIIQVFPTKHAIGIETDNGLEILIHLGIDTVELKGEGFNAFVKVGDRVNIGDKLLEMNIEIIQEKGKSTHTPIFITNMDKVKELKLMNKDSVKAGKDIIMEIKLKD